MIFINSMSYTQRSCYGYNSLTNKNANMPTNRKIFLLFFIGCLSLAYFFRNDIDFLAVETLINNYDYLAPFIFMAIYFISSLLFLPVFVLTLASGTLFGPYWGTLYTLISATLCASTALLITRFFAKEWGSHLSGNVLTKIIDGVNKEGLFFVAFVRLVPLFPFSVSNYAFGLTNVRILPYTITNFFCMLPACFAYSYIGFLGQSAATDSTGQLLKHILIALSLFAGILLLTSLLKKYRQKKVDIPIATDKNN